jgi:hypothetical protein
MSEAAPLHHHQELAVQLINLNWFTHCEKTSKGTHNGATFASLYFVSLMKHHVSYLV